MSMHKGSSTGSTETPPSSAHAIPDQGCNPSCSASRRHTSLWVELGDSRCTRRFFFHATNIAKFCDIPPNANPLFSLPLSYSYAIIILVMYTSSLSDL